MPGYGILKNESRLDFDTVPSSERRTKILALLSCGIPVVEGVNDEANNRLFHEHRSQDDILIRVSLEWFSECQQMPVGVALPQPIPSAVHILSKKKGYRERLEKSIHKGSQRRSDSSGSSRCIDLLRSR